MAAEDDYPIRKRQPCIAGARMPAVLTLRQCGPRHGGALSYLTRVRPSFWLIRRCDEAYTCLGTSSFGKFDLDRGKATLLAIGLRRPADYAGRYTVGSRLIFRS